MRSIVSVLAPVTLASLVFAAPARAQSNAAAAQALFDEATALSDKNEWARACPKLEESQRLEPGVGTLYRLADCYEHVGRTASSWAMFIEVADKAQLKGQVERSQEGRRRAALLEPKLVRLKIDVAGTRGEGFVVKRDGIVVGAGQQGTPVPVDPGPHTVEASAPGKKAWLQRIEITTANADVSVPELDNAPVVVDAPPVVAPSSGLGAQRVIALVVGGLGVVGVAGGTFFGLQSSSKKSDSDAHCNGNVCDPIGGASRDDAISAGNISTITFIAGGALLATSAVLWFTAPKRASSAEAGRASVRAVPLVGAGTGGLLLRGSW